MNNFSIKDIERLSGIKAHTLRIWEHRHNICTSKRKESLHRYYDNEDLKQILRISYLYHHGYKISKIAGLSKEEIRQLATTASGESSYGVFITQMIEAGMDYDQPRFEALISNALSQLGVEKAISKVYYPFLEKIGLLWLTDHVIPAVEHFSSSLIQKQLLVSIDGLMVPAGKGDTVVLLFCPQGEMHEIPLLISQYLLKKNGVKSVYLGTNVSVEELDFYCSRKTVSHLYFHLITNFSGKESGSYLECLAARFPGKKIIASGPEFRDVVPPSSSVTILRSFDDMLKTCSGM